MPPPPPPPPGSKEEEEGSLPEPPPPWVGEDGEDRSKPIPSLEEEPLELQKRDKFFIRQAKHNIHFEIKFGGKKDIVRLNFEFKI